MVSLLMPLDREVFAKTLPLEDQGLRWKVTAASPVQERFQKVIYPKVMETGMRR